MIIISHRGNISGPDKENENKPDQILKVLQLGYYVEIDIWLIGNKLYLGHDSPQYDTDLLFLKSSEKIICHAKNIEALEYLIENNIHCFSHNIDDVVLTSRNWLWVYPGKKLTKNSICVLPEMVSFNLKDIDCLGICTDYIYLYL